MAVCAALRTFDTGGQFQDGTGTNHEKACRRKGGRGNKTSIAIVKQSSQLHTRRKQFDFITPKMRGLAFPDGLLMPKTSQTLPTRGHLALR